MTTTASQYQLWSLPEAQLLALNPVIAARVMVVASDTYACWIGDGATTLQNLKKGSLAPAEASLTGDRTTVATSSSAGAIAVPNTGSATINRILTGSVAVTLPSVAPTSAQSFTVVLVLEQDSVGNRAVSWPAGLLWPGGNAPTLTPTAGKIDVFKLRWTGTRWLGFPEGASFGAAAVSSTKTFYNDPMTGADGSTPKPAWSVPYGGVTIQGNAMTINPGTGQYVGLVDAILGTPDNTNGSTATGAPPVVADLEAVFDMSLADLAEQYPKIGVRVRSQSYQGAPDDLWPSGSGAGLFKTGFSVVLGIAGGVVQVVRGYDTQQVDSKSGIVFPSKDMSVRVKVSGKGLYLRFWAKGTAEPTSSWSYSNATVLQTQQGGTIGFTAGNGSAGTAKPVKISNFASTTPIITPGPATAAPTSDPAGFTRIMTENFATAAAAGTSTGSFTSTYAGSWQPYNDEGSYFPRAMISAHDGYMDVAMDGARGSAGTFGSPTNAYDRVGGRFAMRAMATDAIGNGTAVIIWPTSDVWAEGELDYPESNFEDVPMVHHHFMTPGQEGSSTDASTGVSWREWHVYAVEWFPPGKGATPATGSVLYYVDGTLIATVTTNVPTTAHRFMFQVGNYGNPGHLLIDWVTISSLN